MPSKGDWIKPDGDSAWTEELQCATDIEFGKAHELNAHSLLSRCVCAFHNAPLPPLTVCLPVRIIPQCATSKPA